MKKIFTCVMSVLLMGLLPLFTATSALAEQALADMLEDWRVPERHVHSGY